MLAISAQLSLSIGKFDNVKLGPHRDPKAQSDMSEAMGMKLKVGGEKVTAEQHTTGLGCSNLEKDCSLDRKLIRQNGWD